MDDLSKRIKKSREYAGLTQEYIADKLGVSSKSIKNYEKDSKNVTVDVVKNISLACGVDLVWLLTGQGDMIKTDKKNVVQMGTIIENHMELVKGFKNHEKAKYINEKLIELEGLNEDLLDDVDDQINIMLRTARRMSEKIEKKTGYTPDRRVNKQPHKGHERRKAG